MGKGEASGVHRLDACRDGAAIGMRAGSPYKPHRTVRRHRGAIHAADAALVIGRLGSGLPQRDAPSTSMWCHQSAHRPKGTAAWAGTHSRTFLRCCTQPRQPCPRWWGTSGCCSCSMHLHGRERPGRSSESIAWHCARFRWHKATNPLVDSRDSTHCWL